MFKILKKSENNTYKKRLEKQMYLVSKLELFD